MAELKSLVDQRAVVRRAVTKLCNRATDEIRNNDVPAMQSIRDLLQAKNTILQDLDSRIQQLCEDEDSLEKESDDSMDYQLKIGYSLNTIRNTLATSKPSMGGANVKLPKLQLPMFSGNKLEWSSFWEIFNTSVIKNTTLSEVQKFTYLKSVLQGDAKNCIEGLSLTGSNFSIAVGLLKDRFGVNETLQREHLQKLQELKAPGQSLVGLKRFYDEINIHMRSLANLDVDTDNYEIMLLPNLLGKLQEQLRLTILRRAGKEVGILKTLPQFLHFLQSEIKVREESQETAVEIKQTNSQQNHTGSVTALPTTFQAQKKPKCVYCHGIHYSSDCNKIVGTEARKKYAEENRLCFKCLNKGHTAGNCRSTMLCRNCKKAHHTSLCYRIKPKQEQKAWVTTIIGGNRETTQNTTARNKTPTSGADQTNSTSQVGLQEGVQSLYLKSSSAVVMPSAKAYLHNGTEKILVKVVLDTMSSKTFIRKNLCEKMRIPMLHTEKLNINTFGSSCTDSATVHETQRVKFKISKLDNDLLINLEGNAVETICLPQPSVEVDEYPHLAGLDLADPFDPRDNSMEVDILVGADHYYDIVFGDIIRGEHGPIAVNSKLGWVICGKLTSYPLTHTSCCMNVTCLWVDASKKDILTSHSLNQFWKLEHLGVLKEENKVDEFLNTITFDTESGHYSIRLPWKNENEHLPDNFQLTHKRLQSTLNTLKKDSDLLKKYHNIFQEQLEKGLIEEVVDYSTKGKVHYIPHKPVVRPEAESTKIRVVFDASARLSRNSPSLNESLEQGPCSLPQIPYLLCRFRLNKIPLLADVEKAFHQINIDEQDRDALRFIWIDDPNKETPEMRIYRHAVLPFGLTCSPAVLEKIIHQHVEKYKSNDQSLIDQLQTMYVDNLVGGVEDTKAAFEFHKKASDIFHEGGFNLRAWKSNDPAFMKFVTEQKKGINSPDKDFITEDETSFVNSTLNKNDDMEMTKVLGVNWSMMEDTFFFEFSSFVTFAKSLPLTKRGIAQASGKIYDPLGLLSPLLVTPKVIFQKLSSKGSQWDDPLPEEIKQSWDEWLRQLELFSVHLTRLVFEKNRSVAYTELHGFSDGSMTAYAAAIYIRAIYTDGHISSSLLMSKSRVTPKSHTLTIPRTELLGALILSRLMSFLKPLFPQSDSYCWTDSQNTLHWIVGEHRIWQTFIQNRVIEIRRHCPSLQWRHVPGSENPADLPSRGVTPKDLLKSQLWWNGPESAMRTAKDTAPFALNETNEKDGVELISDKFPHLMKETVTTVAVKENVNLENIMEPKEFCSFGRLLRVTAYVVRFCKLLKHRTHGQREEAPIGTNITTEEFSNAEYLWIKQLQTRAFSKQISHFVKGTPKTKLCKDLNLFMEDGFIKCKGRTPTELSAQSNNPILLPHHEDFESLIILDAHVMVAHGGVSATLAQIRERFWMLRGRQKVKKRLRHCVTCHKVQGLPYRTTKVPDLPTFRTTALRAFQTTGVDYCGPILYRKGEENFFKAYICMFTCAVTRAVHLEFCPDLSANSFLRALRRFVARRGIPHLISDNFKTFTAVSKELGTVSGNSEVQEYCATKRIKWEFVPERAPWFGGFWERMVKEVKYSLKKVIYKASLEFDELQTVILEIEAVLNSRPLTYIVDEVEEVLTPGHFLVMQRLTKLPENDDGPQNELTLQNRITKMRSLLNNFWIIWKNQYLKSLREKNLKMAHGSATEPKIGDIVLVDEENVPRLRWRMGRILEVKTGRDGSIRSARLKISKRGVRGVDTICRPVKLLIPLEV